MFLEDGAGKSFLAKVDDNQRLFVRSIGQTESQNAVDKGDSFSISTGTINYTATGTLLYIKNNEDRPLVIDRVLIGIKAATVSEMPEIVAYRNPTSGDLISDATAVSSNENRNFGSNKTLSADVYKGKSGGTVVGDSIILVYQNPQSFIPYTLDIVLPKGASFAIEIVPNLSSGSLDCTVSALCHLNGENE